MTDDQAASLWRRAIERSAPGQLVVAQVDEHAGLAGVLRWRIDEDVRVGWVDSLYVAPRAQGRGVGGRLLDHAVDAVTGAGATELRLFAFESNAPAIAFYRRHGWQPDGTTRVEAEFGEREIRLTRRSAGPATHGRGELPRVADELVAAIPGETAGPAGIAIAVRSEHVDVRVAVGSRTVEGSPPGLLPMTVETAHDLASVTKVVTTTALMRLVSQRHVGLDDPVQRYVPRFTGAEQDSVTVRDLLLHRGGLREWWPLYAADPRDPDGVIDRLPLRYPVGERYHYSDLGFMLLGRIVATVAASPLDSAIAELVTSPLGLAATRFARPRRADDVAMSAFDDRVEREMLDSGSPYPVAYTSRDFDGWRTDPIVGIVNDGNAFHAYGGVAGHAGLFSTIDDLLTLADALGRATGGDDLIDPAVAHEFFAPGPDEGQSLGFRRYDIELDETSTTLLGHTGFVGCGVGFVPGRGVAVALASNRLVTAGEPASTNDLWAAVITAAAQELAP
jgi:CubicO group peptidase (beta-lactamase class C family)